MYKYIFIDFLCHCLSELFSNYACRIILYLCEKVKFETTKIMGRNHKNLTSYIMQIRKYETYIRQQETSLEIVIIMYNNIHPIFPASIMRLYVHYL